GAKGVGRVVLWGVFLMNVVLVFSTQRGAHGIQYLFPLYSVFPCWLGALFAWLWARRKTLGGLALAVWLLFQLAVKWGDTLGGTERRWRALEVETGPLAAWLAARGVERVYWTVQGLPSFEFTFLTRMQIVASDLWREAALPHAHRVDAALSAPIVTAG